MRKDNYKLKELATELARAKELTAECSLNDWKGWMAGRETYRIQDGIYINRSTLEAIPVKPFKADYSQQVLRCLENCNPDKLIIIDSVPPNERGGDD